MIRRKEGWEEEEEEKEGEEEKTCSFGCEEKSIQCREKGSKDIRTTEGKGRRENAAAASCRR